MRIVFLSALLTTALLCGQNRGSSAPPPPRMHAAAPPSARPSPPPTARPSPPPVSRPPYVPRPYQPRSVVVPYPIFVNGFYGYAPAPAAAPADYGYSDPSPVGLINQDFRPDAVNPSIVDYSNVPLPDADSADANTDENGLKDDQPTIFLIALTDHTVVAAIAYWVDGDTLNWVSREAKQNHMSLSLVDREFSKQLNDERHVEFRLPQAK